MNAVFYKILPWVVGLVAVIIVMSVAQAFRLPIPTVNSLPFAHTQTTSSFNRGGIEPAVDIMGSNGESGVAVSKSMMIAPAPMPPYYGGGDDLGNPDRSIVRSGSLAVLVGDVSSAITTTSDYIKSVKGLVLQSSINTYQGTVTGNMSLRVPEAQFDAVMAWLQKQGRKVESMSVNSFDQTGQVTRTDKQLNQLKDQLADYEAQLVQASSADRLKIQRQIDSLKQQIANWQEQAGNLAEQEAMSSISVTYTKKPFALPVLGSLDLGVVVQEAIDAFIALMQMVFMLAIWAVVFVPIWLPTVLIVKKLTKTS